MQEELALQAEAALEVPAAPPPDPLVSGCNWDIVYDTWTAIPTKTGECKQADPFADCCADAQCVGFMRHSGQTAQCYRFVELPVEFTSGEWTHRPIEIFDASKPSKWSFYLKRPIRLGRRASTTERGAPRLVQAPQQPPQQLARAPDRGGDAASAAAGTIMEQRVHGRSQEAHDVADELHVAFTADCRPFNLWQHELLFYSAVMVGQPGPLTAIISGCSEAAKARLQARHRSLNWPARFTQFFAPTFNDARSRWLSKPYGVQQWYKDKGPDRDVLAIIDPDFVFLRPITASLSDAKLPRDWREPVPPRVQKGLVVGMRYGNVADFGDKRPFELKFEGHDMTEAEFLNWVCSGDKNGATGCNGITRDELSTFHGTGVPYIAHRADWDVLADMWAAVNERLHKYAPKGYYVDMFSWTLANAHLGRRQFIQENLMLSNARARFEDWKAADALNMDVCYTDSEEVLSHLTAGRSEVQALPGHQVPPFLHYCLPIRVPYPSFKDQDDGRLWSKYWFDWGLQTGERHILERCDQTHESTLVGKYPGLTWFRRAPPRRELPNASMPQSERRERFLGCMAKAIFRKAVQVACPDSPLSRDVQGQTQPLDE